MNVSPSHAGFFRQQQCRRHVAKAAFQWSLRVSCPLQEAHAAQAEADAAVAAEAVAAEAWEQVPWIGPEIRAVSEVAEQAEPEQAEQAEQAEPEQAEPEQAGSSDVRRSRESQLIVRISKPLCK